MKFKAIKFEQNGVECFAGVVDAQELVNHPGGCTADYRAEDKEHENGYQREPDDKRFEEIAEYVRQPASLLPGNVIVNLRGSGKFTAEQGCVGCMEIKDTDRIWVVDGQHRLGAFTKTEKHMGIPVTVFKRLPKMQEVEIFRTINRKQKPISTSLLYDLDWAYREGDEKKAEALKLIHDLNSRPDSFWFEQINMTGAKGMNRPINQASFYSTLKKLLDDDTWFEEAFDHEKKYQLLTNYWRAVRVVFPEACADPKHHLLLKTMGVYTMTQYARQVFLRCEKVDDSDFSVETMAKYIHLLRDLPILKAPEGSRYGPWYTKAEVGTHLGMKGYKFVLERHLLPAIQKFKLQTVPLKGLK